MQLKKSGTNLAGSNSIPENKRNAMKTGRRSAVFVIPNYIVGHELVFKHYTNKVVVGKHISTNTPKASEKAIKANKKFPIS